jgi:pimeloyl-ACP methyl ester carboxylesterase
VTFTTHTHRVRGMELAHHRQGDDRAPALVMIHGFLDHGLSYAAVVEAMKTPVRAILIDLRGHGHSGWVGDGGYYHFYDYFDDVRALVDELALTRFTLVGHSMGGSVAIGVAAMLGAARVERLFLLEGMGPPFQSLEGSSERLQRWSDALRTPEMNGDVQARRATRKPMASIELAAERLRRINPRLAVERSRSLASSFTEPVPGGVAWRYDPLHRTPAAKPYIEDEAAAFWRALEMPVWSLYGEKSEWRPDRLAERHRTVKRMTAGVVPDAGHNLHHDRPELIASALDAFLADRPMPAPITPGEPGPQDP